MRVSSHNAVHHAVNGAVPQSQLAHDLDALMEHLDEIQPEHGMPRRALDTPPAHSEGGSLWERLKHAARHLTHSASPHQRLLHAPDAPELTPVPAPCLPASESPPVPPPIMLEKGQAVAFVFNAPAFSVNGHGIRQRADGLYCLNDLLHASGVPRLNHSPQRFLKRARAISLLGALGREHPGTRWVETEKARRRGGGIVSWGCRELMLEYASWLCPRFLHAVLDALRSHEAAPVQEGADTIPHTETQMKDAPPAPEIFNPPSVGMVELPSSKLMKELPDILKTNYAEESRPKGAVKAASTGFTERMSVDLGASLDKVAITSGEIAELVSSRHDNVKRTIERLAKTSAIRLPPTENSEKINNLGLPQKIRHYVFSGEQGKRDSIIVVAQLSPEFTAKLVDRWLELERHAAISAFGVPQTLQAALRMAADLVDENQALKLENQSLKQLAALPETGKSRQAGSEQADITNALTLRELSRPLGIRHVDLCRFLREDGWLLKKGTAHIPAPHAQMNGLFGFRPLHRHKHNAGGYMQLVVTEKGQAHIQQRLAERGLLHQRGLS